MSSEVIVIVQMLDMSFPENELILALHLAFLEVENDRRILNINMCLHKSDNRGDWWESAAKGYWDSFCKMRSLLLNKSQNLLFCSRFYARTFLESFINYNRNSNKIVGTGQCSKTLYFSYWSYLILKAHLFF